MKCPFCGETETQVKDSRPSEDGMTTRRRRFCAACDSRFTTFERVQLRELIVIKKNGDKKIFDVDKLQKSVELAVRKRVVTAEQIDKAVSSIVRELETSGDTEVPSSLIGEKVMTQLEKLDQVAYVRFASVYRDFCETKDFENFIETLAIKNKGTKS